MLALLGLLLAALPACSCAPLAPRFDSPRDTLGTWQAALCHDAPVSEYGCLSRGFRRRIGGWETYQTVRAAFLEREPVAAWILARADLDDAIAEEEESADGRRARIVLEHDGQQVDLLFVRETLVTVHVEGEALDPVRLDEPIETLLGADERSWWIGRQTRPALDAERLRGVRSIAFESPWRIDDLAGFLSEPAP